VNSKYLLWAVLSLPLVWMTWAWQAETLFYGEMIHLTGEFSTRLLMLTMAITPLRTMFPGVRWPGWLLRQRRYLGLAAFGYALLHAIVYVSRKRDPGLIVEEGLEPAMLAGWIAFLLFTVLAITSNDAAVKRLRRAWKALHRWVYVAALLVFAHWIFTAFDPVPGIVHFAILLGLELFRIARRGRLESHEK
jgi:sulfoxide reductase heme-binding subunit YedZ